MSSSINYHWRIAGFYFFYYAFVGMFAPYWSLYLKSLHFDAIDIAILMSLQPVMRMVAPNVWGWLADHTGKRREVVVVAASLSALFYLGVFATTSFWGLFIVLMLMNFFWSASMPLVEATTLTWLGKNTAHYGRLRSWGSIGFILSVVGLGYAFDHIAIAWLLWAGLVCELGILIFARQIPPAAVLAHHTDHQPIKQIVLQPRVLALFGACFLMAAAHGPYYTFFSIYLVEHGYAKSAVGGLWALGVICEIGVFFLMPGLVRRFGFTRILLISFGAAHRLGGGCRCVAAARAGVARADLWRLSRRFIGIGARVFPGTPPIQGAGAVRQPHLRRGWHPGRFGQRPDLATLGGNGPVHVERGNGAARSDADGTEAARHGTADKMLKSVPFHSAAPP